MRARMLAAAMETQQRIMIAQKQEEARTMAAVEALNAGLNKPAKQTLEDCKKRVLESEDVKKMMDDHAAMMNAVQSALSAGAGSSRSALERRLAERKAKKPGAVVQEPWGPGGVAPAPLTYNDFAGK
mmetsp:Transcript_17511/g.43231  ORF Transcript_17511/g.43231 Transcript_17511/m.43231 type:complete len:127 (+) Transcript_17511:1778-2158(+)